MRRVEGSGSLLLAAWWRAVLSVSSTAHLDLLVLVQQVVNHLCISFSTVGDMGESEDLQF